MARTVKEYLGVIEGLVSGMAQDTGLIKTNASAQELVKSYSVYAKSMDGNPDTKKFKEWMADEKLGKAKLVELKLSAEDAAAAEKAASDYMNPKEDASDIFKEAYANGKLAVEKGGNWLSRNWPMLAAIAAPLLLGNFFELGTLPLVGVALAGLGAATYFAGEDSMLGGVKSFIYKQFNLGDPFKKDGPGPSQNQNRDPNQPPVPTLQPLLGMDGVAVANDKVKDVMVATGQQMTINGKLEYVALVGARSGNQVTFDRVAIVDKDGKNAGVPVELPKTFAPIKTMVNATNKIPPISTTELKPVVEKMTGLMPIKATTPAPATTALEVDTGNTVVDNSVAATQRKVLALVSKDNATGKTMLTGYAVADESGKASSVKTSITPVEVKIVDNKLMQMDGKTPFNMGGAADKLQEKADQEVPPVAPSIPTKLTDAQIAALKAAKKKFEENAPTILTSVGMGATLSGMPFVGALTTLGALTGASAKNAKAQADFSEGKVTVSATVDNADSVIPGIDGSVGPQPVTVVVASQSSPNTTRTFKGTMQPDGQLQIDTLVVPDGDKGVTKDFKLKNPVVINGATISERNTDGTTGLKIQAELLSDPLVSRPLTDLVKEIGADGGNMDARNGMGIPAKVTTTKRSK